MSKFYIPNSACLHTTRALLQQSEIFANDSDTAILEFKSSWAHMDPVALTMIASWGTWCKRNGKKIQVENLGRHGAYAARMHLFDHLGVNFKHGVQEREEAGRFLPVTQVSSRSQVSPVIGDISALLHLEDDPESLAAVQYCVSELLRNVLEHASSEDGAFVCAHRYTKTSPHRVTIAVADCGSGIRKHLGRVHKDASKNDKSALTLAMRPGITGAIPGVYGAPDNAGAGLFFTRCIAKGTGGYFLLVSGNAAFRQRRATNDDQQICLYINAMDDPRHDLWEFDSPWVGTVVAVEIRTDNIKDYEGFFQWIFRQIPSKSVKRRRIHFT